MKWTFHEEEGFSAYYESEIGRAERIGPYNWDAWVFLPSELRGHVRKHLVAECYKSAASARGAVVRAYRKHAAVNETAVNRGDQEPAENAVVTDPDVE